MDKQPDWQKKAEIALYSALRTQQKLSYNQLAQIAEVPSPYRIHKLTGWLEETMLADCQQKKPLRAVMVVSKHSHMPATGFFEKAADLGLITRNLSDSEKQLWYEASCEKAYAYYQPESFA